MTAAVVSGTYSDLKIVRTRAVVQMIVEIPLEQGSKVVEAFGLPKPGEEIHVAVARLVEPPRTSGRAHEPAAEPPAERRKWQEMQISQRAALLCQDELFASYLADRRPYDWDAAGCQPVDTLRRICGVKSRSELNTNTAAADRFDQLRLDFWRWKNEPSDAA